MTNLRILLAFLIAGLAGVSPAAAGDAAGAITIPKFWARATPGGATVGAAYGEIRNSGQDADKLLSVSSPVSKRAEIHTHVHADGMMMMRKVESLSVPAGGSLKLAPGGDHLMLFDLTGPLKAGDRVPLKLTFEKAGEIAAEAEVAPVGAMGPADTAK